MHLSDPDTRVLVGDCLAMLPMIEEGSVDLVTADPPFNWSVDYGTCKDKLDGAGYLQFTRNWLDQCIRVLTPTGSLWVNIPDDWAAEIVIHLKARGLTMVNWCINHFRFGQNRDSNFIVSKTHLLYFAMHPKQRVWNPDAILEESDRAAVYDDPRTRTKKSAATGRSGKRVPLDVWYGSYFGRVQGNSKERRPLHNNQQPEVVLERIIRGCSNPGQLVLDPFLGSGTACVVARALNRRSIGIEIDKLLATSAFERIQAGSVRVTPIRENNVEKAPG